MPQGMIGPPLQIYCDWSQTAQGMNGDSTTYPWRSADRQAVFDAHMSLVPCLLHAVEGGPSSSCRQLLHPETLRGVQPHLPRAGSHYA